MCTWKACHYGENTTKSKNSVFGITPPNLRARCNPPQSTPQLIFSEAHAQLRSLQPTTSLFSSSSSKVKIFSTPVSLKNKRDSPQSTPHPTGKCRPTPELRPTTCESGDCLPATRPLETMPTPQPSRPRRTRNRKHQTPSLTKTRTQLMMMKMNWLSQPPFPGKQHRRHPPSRLAFPCQRLRKATKIQPHCQ